MVEAEISEALLTASRNVATGARSTFEAMHADYVASLQRCDSLHRAQLAEFGRFQLEQESCIQALDPLLNPKATHPVSETEVDALQQRIASIDQNRRTMRNKNDQMSV